jgi:hypothetical protein
MPSSDNSTAPARKHTLLIPFLLIVLLTGVLAGRSYAANHTETYPDFKGSSDAVAQANTIYNSSANKFWCIAKENIQNPTASIGTIGFSHWVCTIVQNSQYKWYYEPTPHVDYSASAHYRAYISATVFPISGQTRKGTSEGTHDFKDGSTTWAPYTFHSYTANP